MKKAGRWAVCFFLSLSLLTIASAAAEAPSYNFDLTMDNGRNVHVEEGQSVTVSLVLRRTDSGDLSRMYGMQAELLYDDTFFQLEESSVMTAVGIEWSDYARRSGGRALSVSFVSLAGGEDWAAELPVCTFRLRVIAEEGETELRAENCLVSTPDGSASYTVETNSVSVSLDAAEAESRQLPADEAVSGSGIVIYTIAAGVFAAAAAGIALWKRHNRRGE